MRLIRRTALLVGVLALIVPASAVAAGSSTCQAYNSELCSSVGNSSSSKSTLPFTGLDVVLLAAGGGTLLAGGFVVRRLSRRLN